MAIRGGAARSDPAPDRARRPVHLLRRGDRDERHASRTSGSGRRCAGTATQPAAGFSTATPWQALSDDPAGIDVATQSSDPDSLLSTYRALTRLRASHPALLSGELIPVESADRHVVAFLRSAADETVLVVANLGTDAIERPELSLMDGPLCGDLVATSLAGPAAAAPDVSAGGGFDAYVPTERLARERPSSWRSALREAPSVTLPAFRDSGPVDGEPVDPEPLRPARPPVIELAAAILIVGGVLGLIGLASAAGSLPAGIGPFIVMTILLDAGSIVVGLLVRVGRLWVVAINYAAVLGFLDLLASGGSPPP